MTRTNLLVWLGLMTLLLLTLGLSYVDLGWGSTPVAMGIAVLKTVLVGLFYMHLWESKPEQRFFALAVLAWLCCLFGMTLVDVLSRPM